MFTFFTHMRLATRKNQLKQLRGGVRALPAPLLLLALCALLLVVILIAVSFGSTPIPISTIAQILLNGTGLFHFARQWDPTTEVIVWQLRMPVVIGAALVGSALAVAGVLFQGMLRNPLADPFLIGTSSGAALGAAIAFVLPFDTLCRCNTQRLAGLCDCSSRGRNPRRNSAPGRGCRQCRLSGVPDAHFDA